jgi:hypothetical protein
MNPDLLLALAVAAGLGIGWGAVRTWLTWRVASDPSAARLAPVNA